MNQPDIFIKLNRENIEAYTPKYAVDIILPYISKDKVIWAPFSKEEMLLIQNIASNIKKANEGIWESQKTYLRAKNISNELGKVLSSITNPKYHQDTITDN